MLVRGRHGGLHHHLNFRQVFGDNIWVVLDWTHAVDLGFVFLQSMVEGLLMGPRRHGPAHRLGHISMRLHLVFDAVFPQEFLDLIC